MYANRLRRESLTMNLGADINRKRFCSLLKLSWKQLAVPGRMKQLALAASVYLVN